MQLILTIFTTLPFLINALTNSQDKSSSNPTNEDFMQKAKELSTMQSELSRISKEIKNSASPNSGIDLSSIPQLRTKYSEIEALLSIFSMVSKPVDTEGGEEATSKFTAEEIVEIKSDLLQILNLITRILSGKDEEKDRALAIGYLLLKDMPEISMAKVEGLLDQRAQKLPASGSVQK